ncbi:putative cadmium-transporting ATPase [Strawberry lethal yellows phytoplasma (CPA) str. NZSb11]|uniref:Putative cadmium-transporting ATPase n=1 Tax=Strawberry lethal yellows phytoplasma (CPA) str. NZSb11 TaxID=980422 RepID=R4RNM1_PHYAS|nr:putative cadmium-transporting ATPase [Strawberry lethal yellows phytoplasma (CPA) str. NZSb11]
MKGVINLNVNNEKTNQKPLICFFIGIFLYLIFFLWQRFNFSTLQPFSLPFALIILFLLGYSVISEGFIDTCKESKANKKFTPNIDILMSLAALGSLFLANHSEAILLILIFSGASFLEQYVENKSQKEIKNLLKLHPSEARLLQKDGSTQIISSQHLKTQDLLLILEGDAIPTDGVIISGYPCVDESNITGESIPCEKQPGDLVYGSTINVNNTFVMRVTTTNEKTVFAQIVKLVSQTKNSFSKTATLIKKIEPVYVKAIMFIVIFVLTIGGIINFLDASKLDFGKLFSKTMVFLTVSSPCALAASDIPSTLAAITNLAKKGVLFKNVKSLEIMAETKAFACDKTGTLTEGKPEVTDLYVDPHISEEKYQHYLEILLAMEQKSNHPFAAAIKNYFNIRSHLMLEITNLVGVGIEAFYQNDYYLISKAIAFPKVSKDLEIKTEKFLSQGKTVIYFSSNNRVLIALAFLDKVRLPATKLIDYFNKKNINTVVISGDNEQSVLFLKEELNLKQAWGNNLPIQKVKKIQQLQNKYGITVMVGDGVNDAPALRVADVGIAMQNGTDVSIDVADAVLMKNDLSKIIYTHKVALKLNKIIRQNIFFAMSVVVVLNLINMITQIPLPLAVFCHEGSTLLVILNALRLLKSEK